MVYGFVRQSNGHIRIDSAIGQGTSVKLYLPRTLDPVAEPEGPPAGATTGSEHILVVEDNDDVRRAVVDMLSGWGYRVTAAENPDVAVGILEKDSNFDLLFTDVGLAGGVNGEDLADAAHRRWPGLKVLLTTGYARSAIVPEDRLEVITKPYTQTSLAERIQRLLDRG